MFFARFRYFFAALIRLCCSVLITTSGPKFLDLAIRLRLSKISAAISTPKILRYSDFHLSLYNMAEGDGMGFPVRVHGNGRLSDVFKFSHHQALAFDGFAGGHAHHLTDVPLVILQGLEGSIQSGGRDFQGVV